MILEDDPRQALRIRDPCVNAIGEGSISLRTGFGGFYYMKLRKIRFGV